ncbi:MAG: hypothetical protein QW505_04245 [Thermoplasmata archaeon]
MRRRKRNFGEDRKARSNGYDEGRRRYIRAVYLRSRRSIERDFLASLDGKDISQEERMRALRAFRDGALEILSAVEEVFGIEGLEKLSLHLRLSDLSGILDFLRDNECDCDDCEDEYECCARKEDFDDMPWTYENLNPEDANPHELLRCGRHFPVELVDEDEIDFPDEFDDDDDEEDELDFGILEKLIDWDRVRDLWKDFDSMYG